MHKELRNNVISQCVKELYNCRKIEHMSKKALLFPLIISSLLGVSQNVEELKEVEISATRSQTTMKKNGRSVSVISKQEIEEAPVTSIDELLDYAVNSDMRQRGYFNMQTDVSLRGSSFDQVLILLNGVKLADPQTGHHSMDLPVTVEDIERIEILYGGASRIFGVYAFAGAVNIITKNSDNHSVSGGVTAGEYGLREYRGSGTLAFDQHSHRITAVKRESDGYMENTDFDYTNLFWQSEYHTDKLDVTFNAGYTDKGFGSQNFYSAAFPDQYSAVNILFGSLQGSLKTGDNGVLTGRTYYRRNQSRFELFRESEDFYRRVGEHTFVRGEDTLAPWYTTHNYHVNTSYGAEVNYTQNWKWGETSAGFEYREEGILSNNLGTPMGEVRQVPGEPDYAVYDKSHYRTNYSAYLEHSFQIENLFVSLGTMYNINTEFGNNFFPGIDVSYMAGKHFKPYASVNRSLRFPTFTDLYYSLGNAQGSEHLMPEHSINYEAGTYFYGSGISGRVSLFRREGRNLIDWIRYTGSDTAFASNLTRVNLNGAELDVRLNPKKFLGEKFPVNSLRMSYSYMVADSTSQGFESSYALDFLEHKAGIKAGFNIYKGLSASLGASYQKRIGSYATAEGQTVPFPNVFLTNLRLTQEIRFFRIFAEASNLLDQEYVDIGNVRMPGRWIRAGVSFKFDEF